MFDFLKRKPDFLIVGAQKSGTTALQSFLNQHPRIKCAERKEVGFFNRDKCYQQGAAWYTRHFPRPSWPGTLLFEATPDFPVRSSDQADRSIEESRGSGLFGVEHVQATAQR